jgi:endonuclease/exonuclease/phosphatase (EEP) superfamily protein YafD
MARRAVDTKSIGHGRRPAYEPELYDDEPPYWLWLISIVLFLLTAAPYLLGDTFIELEVFVAQPLLRLLMLLGAGACAALALYRIEYIAAILPGICFVFLLFETWASIGHVPMNDVPAGRSRYLHVYTQNIGSESPEEFISLLASGKYDLVLLQEAYVGHRKGWEVLAEQLGYEHSFHMLRSDAGMGVFFMSKMPMKDLPTLAAQSWGRTVRQLPGVQIEFRKKLIDVYAVHLESLPLVEGKRMIMGSSALRHNQAETLAAVIEDSSRVIVAGDFNAAPLYRSAAPLRDLLDDAWVEGGWGFGFTYHASFAFARIDAILQKGFDCEYAEIVRVSDSDHRGIYAVLSLDN